MALQAQALVVISAEVPKKAAGTAHLPFSEFSQAFANAGLCNSVLDRLFSRQAVVAGIGRPTIELTYLAAYRIHRRDGFSINPKGWRGLHSGRESLDFRSLQGSAASPLNGLPIRAFFDGVFRSLDRSLF